MNERIVTIDRLDILHRSQNICDKYVARGMDITKPCGITTLTKSIQLGLFNAVYGIHLLSYEDLIETIH